MKKVINIHKPLGISPLDAINIFRTDNPAYKDVKMTYAGRLDPLASGVLLVLAGEEIYKKEDYLKLDKEYEADILFGASSDTYDILGLPTLIGYAKANDGCLKVNIESELKRFVGDVCLPLPPFSSYKVNGKPLFEWARRDKLNEIKIPKRIMKIYSAELLGLSVITAKKLLKDITNKINNVAGDFRQKKITERWRDILSGEKKEYLIAKIKFNVSSGTYIRAIAHKFGENLKTGAILSSLKRTKVGEFNIEDSIKLQQLVSGKINGLAVE